VSGWSSDWPAGIHLHAQFLQRPAHLRQPRFIHWLAGRNGGVVQNHQHSKSGRPEFFLFPQLLVKIPQVEVEILFLVQRQHPLGGRHRYPWMLRLLRCWSNSPL
jgi:hypothetical protein